MASFVLVPGAWLGAWAWEGTVRALRERGHEAHALALTGVGERASEGTRRTDLDTHTADILEHVERHGTDHVTLVAHSYAAAPVTMAAGRLGPRLSGVVHLDSAPFSEGMAMLDLVAPEEAARLREEVAAHGDGWLLPMPPADSMGTPGAADDLGPAQREELRARGTAQPFRTFEQPVHGVVEPDPDVDRVLIACHDFSRLLDADLPPLAHLRQPPWRRFDLPTGHWPMLSAPDALARVLDEAVRTAR
jgi:pimeloyl-ACP methyl ester carboxylesterase